MCIQEIMPPIGCNIPRKKKYKKDKAHNIIKEKKMKRALIYFIFFTYILVSINLINSIQTLPTQKQGDCQELIQSHSNATSINITKIKYPPTSGKASNYTIIQMTTTNNINYYYNFCDTKYQGEYIITTCGNGDGVFTCVDYDFEISASGQNDTNNLVFIIFIIIIIYAIAFIGFFFKNEIIALLGGMFMIGLSIYLINNGIIIYRDWITNYFAYLTLAIGAFFSILSSMSLYEDL